MSQQQKRKNDATSQEMTGREKKKVRMAEARTIPVESAAAGPSTPRGPSTVVPMTRNSQIGLPSAIDIERLVESRSFEVKAMQTAMKTAQAGSTQRAWQLLPRAQRRRAASHDVRRVPQRLRGRALAEMDAPPPKKEKMPQRGKGNQISRTESFLRRQKDKTWLETHIWHAKRMHMKNMYGYRLAVKPTEKAYRPSHRASVQGAIMHDASYYSLVELRGTLDTIVGVLNFCCDPQGPSPGTVRFSNGARTRETHIYEAGTFPYGLIAPMSIIWHPAPDIEDSKGKGKETAPSSSNDRVVWLRFHPAVHQKVLSALQSAGSQYLQIKKDEGDESVELQICDLKDQVNVFEIMGPQASQVIRGALTAVSGDDRQEFKQFWSSLADLQTSGSVPRNTVIGFKVLDPRLHFPPKRAKPTSNSATSSYHIFPCVALARSDIWDEKTRLGLAKPKYTKEQLDDRRAKNPIPGTPLKPQRQDDRVPVLLIQRSIEAPTTSKSGQGQGVHGWTLIVPSGWGMAFWSSLIFTGVRVAGQRERQTQSYEAGATYFPRDYPMTDAYEQFAKEEAEEMQASWDRKPPAKRTNFEKKDVDDPFYPNWHGLLGIEPPKEVADTDDGDLVSTQRESRTATTKTTNSAPTPIAQKVVKPWLLRGSKTREIVANLASSSGPLGHFRRTVNDLRLSRGLPTLDNTLHNEALMLAGALVNVKVDVCKRGMPTYLCLIYSLTVEELKAAHVWLNQKSAVGGDADDDLFKRGNETSSDALIGRVTTGNYSLSIGKGYAIGAVPLKQYLRILARQPESCERGRHPAPLVKIRNTNNDQYRLARLELIVEGDD